MQTEIVIFTIPPPIMSTENTASSSARCRVNTYTKELYDFLHEQHKLGNRAWFAIPCAIQDGLWSGIIDGQITSDQIEFMLIMWDKAKIPLDEREKMMGQMVPVCQ